MQINGYEVNDRHNRPGVTTPVALRVFFINDGKYYDPYEISGVTVFAKTAHTSPSSVLNAENIVASSAFSKAKMNFTNPSPRTSSPYFLESLYYPISTASGIYRLGVGEYAVVLDGGIDLSGSWNFYDASTPIANTASAATEYLDVWTINEFAGSKLKSIINDFTLFDNTFFTVTQPLLLTPKSKLVTKKVHLGAKVDMEIGNEISIGNRAIDSSIKNIFKNSVIASATVEIVKHNDETSLPSRVTVSSFEDTEHLVDITADNTLLFNFDTSKLSTHASVTDGTFGSLTGTYTIQAKFNMLHEHHLTDRFYFTIE